MGVFMKISAALWAALCLWSLSSSQVVAADPQLEVVPPRYDYMITFEPTGGPGRISALPTVDSSPMFDTVICNTGGTPGNYWTSYLDITGTALAAGACAPLYRIGSLQITTTWRAQIFVRLSQPQK